MNVNIIKDFNVRNRIYFYWNDSINISDLDLRNKLARKSGVFLFGVPNIKYHIECKVYLSFVGKYIKDYDRRKHLTSIPSNENKRDILQNMKKFGIRLNILFRKKKKKEDNSGDYFDKHLKIKINSDDDFMFRKKLRILCCEYMISFCI